MEIATILGDDSGTSTDGNGRPRLPNPLRLPHPEFGSVRGDVDKEAIIASATQAAFGRPLVNNVLRAIHTEAIIDAALGEGWEWCFGDWTLCDFRHADATRLEVKQSAARQSWHQDGDKPSVALFDIAPRKQAWDGLKWVPSTGRNAGVNERRLAICLIRQGVHLCRL